MAAKLGENLLMEWMARNHSLRAKNGCYFVCWNYSLENDIRWSFWMALLPRNWFLISCRSPNMQSIYICIHTYKRKWIFSTFIVVGIFLIPPCVFDGLVFSSTCRCRKKFRINAIKSIDSSWFTAYRKRPFGRMIAEWKRLFDILFCTFDFSTQSLCCIVAFKVWKIDKRREK